MTDGDGAVVNGHLTVFPITFPVYSSDPLDYFSAFTNVIFPKSPSPLSQLPQLTSGFTEPSVCSL